MAKEEIEFKDMKVNRKGQRGVRIYIPKEDAEEEGLFDVKKADIKLSNLKRE